MPTYDYECDACGHEFELFQQMTASLKRKCPECGKLKLRRLVGTGAGVIFKGSGFYQTDYRGDSYRKDAEAEKKPAAEKGKKDGKKDGKTDSSKPTSDAKSPASADGSKTGERPGGGGSS